MTSFEPTETDLGTTVSVHSGFPNAAVDNPSQAISLDRLLVPRPHSTYLFRIEGDGWAEMGIFSGDIAIIDRAEPIKKGSITVNWDSDGSFRIGRWPNHQPEPWGVITTTIHRLGHIN